MGDAQIRGSRYTVNDMLVDMGATRQQPDVFTDGSLGSLVGIPVVYDDSVPKGVIDIRDDSGAVRRRLLCLPDGRWVSFDLEALRRIGADLI